MARPLRILYPGAVYHITSRGNERKAVFRSIRDREKFLEYLESAVDKYQALIHAYCLMDNHYHLLLETPSGNLPRIMRHINGAYTTYFNVKRDRAGHLFQGRYKAILVEKDEYAKELSRYIHLNPVRAKMVEAPEEYVWSSYQSYIGIKKTPKWLFRDFILGYFGKKSSVAQIGYRGFVESLINKEYQSPISEMVNSTILGSAAFIGFVKDNFLKGTKPDKNIPALSTLADTVKIDDIFDAVAAEFGKERAICRSVKLYLSQRLTDEKLKDIGGRFGIGESGVSQACRRVKAKMKNDKKLAKNIAKVEEKLTTSRVKT
jgi:putative transposase